MVTIPARLAMRMARYMLSLGDLHKKAGNEKGYEAISDMVRETVDAISEQCNMVEVQAAGMAL